MSPFEALFAAIDADPGPIIDAAIRRLAAIEGKPTRLTAREVRFRPNRSLWIDLKTGNWRDHAASIGGNSWRLATELAAMGTGDIASLYNIDVAHPMDARRSRKLREEADRRRQALATAEEEHRRLKRRQANQLIAGAKPAAPGDLASRYLMARGLHNLDNIWFHPGPTLQTESCGPMHLGPSALFQVTDGFGEITAAHCIQLNTRTAARLSGQGAKLSIGSLIDGYVRFGPRSAVACLGEGAETVASVHEVVRHWRCLACCSGVRFVDDDPDLAAAEHIVLLAERGVEDTIRERALDAAECWPQASMYLAHAPDQVPGEKADMNDVLRQSPDLVRHALSANQLEAVKLSG